MTSALPDPALIVLVGAPASGKSVWARGRYRAREIVSSDDLRETVGSGPHDLDATTEAFALLDQIVTGRLKRGLTTVVDTVGLDPVRRRAQREAAAAVGLPAVAIVLATPDALCRERNRTRDWVVPAPALAGFLKRMRSVGDELAAEGWDRVVTVRPYDDVSAPADVVNGGRQSDPDPRHSSVHGRFGEQPLEVILNVSRFPWGADPAAWLRDVALAADHVGFSGIALMDHLIQIPQVGRSWEPIPEPWVTLGMLAGLDSRLRLGTLVSPATFRRPGILAKSAATLDSLSGGRAFVGVGAGWWEREHTAYGLAFPPARERLDLLEESVETMRALWASGTKRYAGERVSLPETTCYPRPVSDVPIVVGGSGERRTLAIAARLGDACNLPSDEAVMDRKIEVLRQHCRRAGRDPAELALTVLDVPVIGRDRDDVWQRVERLRGRSPVATYAKQHHAGTIAEQRDRYAGLADRGVSAIFLALPDLAGPDDVLALEPLTTGW